MTKPTAYAKDVAWRHKRAGEKRRAMDAAQTPHSDAELIRQHVEAGKVKRLPTAPASGASMAERGWEWE